MDVLFHVAAGPRLGYGHLVRSVWLSRALGAVPIVAPRGSGAARDVARRLGGVVVPEGAATAIRHTRPDLVVVDDPDGRVARHWCDVARRFRVPVASVHDLGIGICDADLVIDGSVARNEHLARRPDALVGPRFAIVNPALGQRARRGAVRRSNDVLIALGGGPRARLALDIGRRVADRRPGTRILIAQGFHPTARPGDRSSSRSAAVIDLGPSRGLVGALSRCAVAVVAGGMTLYEACAAGTPVVAVAVTEAQRPTVRGFAHRGAAIDGGLAAAGVASSVDTIVRGVDRLLDDTVTRGRLARGGRSLVDGRGAPRVAARLRRLVASREAA